MRKSIQVDATVISYRNLTTDPGSARVHASLCFHAFNAQVGLESIAPGMARLLLLHALAAVHCCWSCSAEQTAHAAAEMAATTTTPTLGTYAYSDELVDYS